MIHTDLHGIDENKSHLYGKLTNDVEFTTYKMNSEHD